MASGPYTARLYENVLFLPRAYVGFGVSAASPRRQGRRRRAGHRADFDPSREVVRIPRRDSTPPAASRAEPLAPPEPCQYRARSFGSATVTCTLDRPGHLVIAETRYAGREVKVDGTPTPTFAANGTEIGVELDAGTHEILLDYRPRYRWLVPVSVPGLIACPSPVSCRLPRPAEGRPLQLEPLQAVWYQ